jgi:hypothetical protein
MKAILLFFCGSLLWLGASAQKVYFIYLQSDNQSPFYVKMGEKLHSSTASGYLILSNLVDSTYQLNIGFPGTGGESRFRVSNNNKDKGFLIQQSGGTIQLFDLQAASVHKPVTESMGGGGVSYRMKEDAFTKLLAQAMNDSSLLYVEVTAKPALAIEKKVEAPSPAIAIKNDQPEKPATENVKQPLVIAPTPKSDAPETAGIKTGDKPKDDKVAKAEEKVEEPKKEEAKEIIAKVDDKPKEAIKPVEEKPKPVVEETSKPIIAEQKETQKPELKKEEAYRRSVVTRRSESSTTEGFGLVYLDESNGITDTIRIVIPNQRTPFRAETDAENAKEKKAFLDVTNTDTVAEKKPVVAEVPVRKPCPNSATDQDFLKLRRNMASEDTEDGMLAQSRKAWKNKCFTTEQIRNLSTLFLTAYGKFQFFEAAYLHVSDSDQYASLRSELKEEYYIKRFNALIEQ